MTGQVSRPGYRADVDGLRGIAVGAVALFHAGLAAPGGYVGVDVFFVISGYLITGILLGRLDAGGYSYLGFLARRARRLVPAVVPLLLFVTLVVLWTRPPHEARFFGQSISHVALMHSDWFFFENSGYFDPAAETLPLLHFWSLAVEAKFYLVYPLILAAIWRFCSVETRRRVAFRTLAALAVLSFAACVMVQPVAPSAAFYLAPFRFWELLVGGLVAMLGASGHPRLDAAWAQAADRLSGAVSSTLVGGIGLAAILGPVFLFTGATAHPNWITLIPVLGAASLLALGVAAPAAPVVSFLASRPLLGLGLVSYSFYLWHWPVLVFARDVTLGPLSPLSAALALAVALGAAITSYLWVERVFRRAPPAAVSGVRRYRVGLACGGVAAVVLAGGGVLQSTKGWPQRFYPTTLAILNDDSRYIGLRPERCGRLRAEEGASAGEVADLVDCRVGASDQPARVAIWGDSHAAALAPGLDTALGQAAMGGVLITEGGCPALTEHPPFLVPARRLCARQSAETPVLLNALGVDAVLLVGAWERYTHNPDEWAAVHAALERTIARLRAADIAVWIATPAPELSYSAPRRLFLGEVIGLPPPPSTPVGAYLDQNAAVLDALLEAASADEGVAVLAQHEAVCGDTTCQGHAVLETGPYAGSRQPLYADAGHINPRTARSLAPAIAALLATLKPKDG